MKADLHIHSNISDGSDPIPEIIEKAWKKGLDAIAITDHDTISHLKRIPQSNKIKVTGGIEISAIDPETKIKAHVLGYCIQDTGMMEAFAAPILQRRHENSLRQIKLLGQNGFRIDIDQLHKADGRYIYKQHIMEYLVATGQTADMFGPFYQTVFKHGGFCDFDIEYADVREAVEIVHSAGGKAVLAHPGQQHNFYLLDLLPFDGIEYCHMANSAADKEVIRAYVEKGKTPLFLTGGSDYHGRYEDIPVDIGDYISCESGVLNIC
jgi:predicted metal-dependent phosphoesterase TrpH